MSSPPLARSLMVAGLAVVTLLPTGCSMFMPPMALSSSRCGDMSSSQVNGTTSVLSASGPIRLPVKSGTPISSGYGQRWGTLHQGIDFAGALGDPIYAALDGVVVRSGVASGFGNWIVIDSLDTSNQKVSTVYGHMESKDLLVKQGQTVRAGDHIANIGNAGSSTGAHLHFEYWEGGSRLDGGHSIDPMLKVGSLVGTSSPAADGGSVVGVGGLASGAAASQKANCSTGFGSAGGALDTTKVPADLAPWYQKAGSLCPEISAPLLAAQGKQESGGWKRDAKNATSGASGLAQFLPSTAIATNPEDGQPYVLDSDGNGTASVWDAGDAIIGQGRYMCMLAHLMQTWLSQGKVSGDLVSLALAGYNAGQGKVEGAGGIPQIPETLQYIQIILADEANFRSTGASGEFVASGMGTGQDVVTAARQWLGTPYVWGGGGVGGPSKGADDSGQAGFDCSGLVVAAVFAASGGKTTLPRTSEQQWSIGTEISLDKAAAGDLLFGSWGSGGPGHVGIYVSPGRMLHAPTQGGVVEEAAIQADMRVRRIR